MSNAHPHVPETTLEDRLYTVKYRDAGESHLDITSADVCVDCTSYECTSVCPAGVWQTDDNDDDLPTIAYENCLECGSCRFACPYDNVEWTYPDTGSGVVFKH